MKKKQLLIILLVCLIPLAFYLYHGEPIGSDGLAYASAAVYGTPVPFNTPLLMQWQIDSTKILPQGMRFNNWIVLIWLTFVSIIFGISFLGELFDSKNGWMAGLFSFTTIQTVLNLFEFDRTALGLDFAVWSLLFYFTGVLQNKKFDKWIGIIGLCIGGLIAWNGLIFLALALATIDLIFGIISLPIILAKFSDFLTTVFPDWRVAENTPLIGMLWLMFLNIGYWQLPSQFLYPVIVLTALTIMNGKFALLLTPFLCVGVTRMYSKIEFKETAQGIFLGILIVMVLLSSASILNYYPKIEEKASVLYAIQVAQNNETGTKKLLNDWSFGYDIRWFSKGTIEPSAYGGFGAEQDYNNSKAIVLTTSDTNCFKLKDWNYENETIKVYDCR